MVLIGTFGIYNPNYPPGQIKGEHFQPMQFVTVVTHQLPPQNFSDSIVGHPGLYEVIGNYVNDVGGGGFSGEPPNVFNGIDVVGDRFV